VHLTDAQWAIIEPLIPKPRGRKDRRGRPWREPRKVLGGVLWVLRTGAPWKDRLRPRHSSGKHGLGVSGLDRSEKASLPLAKPLAQPWIQAKCALHLRRYSISSLRSAHRRTLTGVP